MSKAWGLLQGWQMPEPPGHTKFANALPLGLSRRANTPQWYSSPDKGGVMGIHVTRIDWCITDRQPIKSQLNRPTRVQCHQLAQNWLTLTLKMTTPLLVEMLVTVDNSALQEYTHLDDHFYYSTLLFTMLFPCLLVDTLSAHSHKILDVLTLISL